MSKKKKKENKYDKFLREWIKYNKKEQKKKNSKDS